MECGNTLNSKLLCATLQNPFLLVLSPSVRRRIRLATPSVFHQCVRPGRPQQCYEVVPLHRPTTPEYVPFGSKCGQGKGSAERREGY